MNAVLCTRPLTALTKSSRSIALLMGCRGSHYYRAYFSTWEAAYRCFDVMKKAGWEDLTYWTAEGFLVGEQDHHEVFTEKYDFQKKA